MPLPDPVDDDAHGDRLAEDRVGELEPAAALRERRRLAVGRAPTRKWRGASAPRLYGLPRRLTLRFTGFSTSRDAVDERVLAAAAPCAAPRCRSRSAVDVAPAVGAQLPLEAPAAERPAARA